MTDNSADVLSTDKYPERITSGSRMLIVLILSGMLFPFVAAVAMSLLGDLIGGLWSLITTLLAIAVGWRVASVARNLEFEERTRIKLALAGGGGLIVISTISAILLSSWTTSHINFRNDSGEPIDLMIATDESFNIHENFPTGESMSSTELVWGDRVSLHLRIYYRHSRLNTTNRIQADFANEMDLKIDPRGVIISRIPERKDLTYTPDMVKADANGILDVE